MYKGFKSSRGDIRNKEYIQTKEKRRISSSEEENKTEGWIVIEDGRVIIDHFEACKICGLCKGGWIENNKIKECIIPCG